MLTGILGVTFSLFFYTNTQLIIHECVSNPILENRTIRVLEASNGNKIIIKGVFCYSA
jgi:hypothetical protein